MLSQTDTQRHWLPARYCLRGLCDFLGTFVVYVNRSDRLVFLEPALVVLSGRPTACAKVIFWTILAIMWLPVLPYGGTMLNLGCLALAPFALFLLLVATRRPAVRAARKGGPI
ncbi:MAG: hypothetical protein RIM84_02745 [Alphaproteobacteria bacterium]